MTITQSETESPSKNKKRVLRATALSRECKRASFQHAEMRKFSFKRKTVGRKRKKAEQRENTQAGTQVWAGRERQTEIGKFGRYCGRPKKLRTLYLFAKTVGRTK